jgi:GTPase SAR1 family protein
LIIGMAGTGKTTLTQRINHYVVENGIKSYFVNLDPAVIDVPFAASIDIRDTVDYKGVMSKFRLGPNGAIMTSLNLFATKIDQVIGLIERRVERGYAEPAPGGAADDDVEGEDDQDNGPLEYVFVDTPGQIEVFTWSASGQLIMEAFGASFPTCLLFVADSARCSNPQTFMSTMLYSCSILYKAMLPLTVVFNKADVSTGARAASWLQDLDAFTDAIREHKTYSATLAESLSLFLHEFYEQSKYVSVSAVEGTGLDELRLALEDAREQYERDYAPQQRARVAEREQNAAARDRANRRRFEADAAVEE